MEDVVGLAIVEDVVELAVVEDVVEVEEDAGALEAAPPSSGHNL